jgi:hypothetical protein
MLSKGKIILHWLVVKGYGVATDAGFVCCCCCIIIKAVRVMIYRLQYRN